MSGQRDEIFDWLPIGLFRTDPDGNVLRGNRALGLLFGLPADCDARGASTIDYWLDPEERREWTSKLERHGRVEDFDARFRRTDGVVIWVRLCAQVVRNDEADTIYYEGAAIDVTERRRAAEQLERSLSLHRATLESTTDGILVVDLDGKILSYNRRFAEMWRVPQHVLDSRDDERALGSVLDQLVDGEAFLSHVRELYGRPDSESHDELRFKDGRVFERYSRPQRIGGRSVGRVWSFRDITASRRLEEQLRQSQRLEAVGKLAGGVAHDFNNLLTAILGYSELMKQRLDQADPAHAQVEEIARAADRATGLTRQLLAFSRKQVLQPRTLDLNQCVESTEAMLQRLIGEHIRLVTSLNTDLGSVRADPGQIQQVIVNLAVNARDAMPDGGKLLLETRNAWLDEDYARTHVDVEPGAYAVLSISDTGIGMDRETRAHVFEPFFTTKRVGEGTGLGLSTVYGIVRQSQGHIWVYSEPGLGTTFKIYLPVVGELPEALEASVDRGAIPGGRETLLLAEDDDSVRGMISGFLRQLGYRVLEAADGEQALDLVEADSRPIDLLLTDIVMPKVGGPELSNRLRPRRPELRVLFMTGYPGDAIGEHGLLDDDAPMIEKPFTLQELAHRVRRLLDERSQGSASAAATGDQTST